MSTFELWPRFAALFDGLDIAFGTGAGRWVKRPLRPADWVGHLNGQGPGIGVAPLRPDNTVKFAAIDLDEPDFDAAREMQKYIPGTSFVERSRSGNAHVWVFFKDPIPAWIPMGILKEVTIAAGKNYVEVFPKNHDFSKVLLGNYINLPYHGKNRPVLTDTGKLPYTLKGFIESAEASLNDPEDWHARARWLLISPPEQRESSQEFGTQKVLHICAQHILSGDAGPITEGGRNAVLFMLAKCLTNWEAADHDEALEILCGVNQDLISPPEDEREIQRILANVERGQYTSTGCDDPLVLAYTHPDCRIANPRR